MSATDDTIAATTGPIVHPLKFPITFTDKSGDVIDQINGLTLNRLRGGAARRVLNAQQKGAGEFAFVLICESAGIPPSTFEKLDAEDVFALTEVASGFLGVAPAKSS